jgi:cobalt/nickel transport protein
MLRRTVLLTALLALGWQTLASAHFHMLFPETPSAVAEKPVSFLFQFGHPFEHELFNTAFPEKLVMFAPDRQQTVLTDNLQKTASKGTDGKDVTGYRFTFTPPKRGDYTCVATTAPLWMEHEKQFLQDSAKVVLHVQTQKNWDMSTGGFELTPLTRPYGLQPGMVFQAQVLNDGKPQAGVLAEVERYNPTAPKELPADEQVTRRVKADPNGVLTCTLTEPGWWCLTAEQAAGDKEHDGKSYPLIRRTTFWVYVDSKP